MNKTELCYSPSTLQQYASGWLSDQESDSIEQHLSTCSACEQRLASCETASDQDQLLDSLRKSDYDLVDTVSDLESANDPIDPISDNQAIPPTVQTFHSEESVVQQVLNEIQHWSFPAQQKDGAGFQLPLIVDQYELMELIGQGGMAQVYRARHLKLQRTVAIKLLNVPRWQVPQSLNRLEREIAVVGQLHHAAIVAATDAGQYQGVPYLVTELIDGLNLSQLARLPDLSSQANACEAIRVAALGLAYAHAQGVIHRDIKPSNLMVDRKGQVKILDFGLVHLDGWQRDAMELTTVGQLLGTLDYMAPEQADRAMAVDHRSDIYALAATLFRLLCGRAPYAASLYQSPLEKLRLLALTDPPKAETLSPELPQELATLINRSLSRELDLRPPSAAHFAESLSPFCDGADLANWVQQAMAITQQKQSQSTSASFPSLDSINADGSYRLPFSTSANSLQQLHRLGNSESNESGNSVTDSSTISSQSTESSTLAKNAGSGRFFGRWIGRMLVATGFLAALIFGILIVLETQKGQIVIESESAKVSVAIRKDGRQIDQIQVQPGMAQTRLWAGTYEITIDGESDNFELDRQTVTLKKGEVVLARVTQKPAETAGTLQSLSGIPSESNDGAIANEPMYKGVTYTQWAAIFRFERDTDSRAEAINALAVFVEPTLRQQARELFVSSMVESMSRGELEDASLFNAGKKLGAISANDWNRLSTAVKELSLEKQIEAVERIALLIPGVRQTRSTRSVTRIETTQDVSTGQLNHYFEFLQQGIKPQISAWSDDAKNRLLVFITENLTGNLLDHQDFSSIEPSLKKFFTNFDSRSEFWISNSSHSRLFTRTSLAEVPFNVISNDLPATPTLDIPTVEKLLALQLLTPFASVDQAARLRIKLQHWLESNEFSVWVDRGWTAMEESSQFSEKFFRTYVYSSANGPGRRVLWWDVQDPDWRWEKTFRRNDHRVQEFANAIRTLDRGRRQNYEQVFKWLAGAYESEGIAGVQRMTNQLARGGVSGGPVGMIGGGLGGGMAGDPRGGVMVGGGVGSTRGQIGGGELYDFIGSAGQGASAAGQEIPTSPFRLVGLQLSFLDTSGIEFTIENDLLPSPAEILLGTWFACAKREPFDFTETLDTWLVNFDVDREKFWRELQDFNASSDDVSMIITDSGVKIRRNAVDLLARIDLLQPNSSKLFLQTIEWQFQQLNASPQGIEVGTDLGNIEFPAEADQDGDGFVSIDEYMAYIRGEQLPEKIDSISAETIHRTLMHYFISRILLERPIEQVDLAPISTQQPVADDQS